MKRGLTLLLTLLMLVSLCACSGGYWENDAIVHALAGPNTRPFMRVNNATYCDAAPRALVHTFRNARRVIYQLDGIDDVIDEVAERAERDERTLITTLTKKMAEDLTDHLLDQGIRARYMHSDIGTLERVEILRDLHRKNR